jgi:hypothetical protein
MHALAYHQRSRGRDYGLDNCEDQTFFHWWLFSCYRAPLLWVLKRRKFHGGDSTVPSHVSISSKICHALLAINFMHLADTGTLFFTKTTTGRQVFAFADEHDLLSGKHEACPAPKNAIEGFIDAMLAFDCHVPSQDPTAVEAIEATHLHFLLNHVSLIYDALRLRALGAKDLSQLKFAHPLWQDSWDIAQSFPMATSMAFQRNQQLISPIAQTLGYDVALSSLHSYLGGPELAPAHVLQSWSSIQALSLELFNRLNDRLARYGHGPHEHIGVLDLLAVFGDTPTHKVDRASRYRSLQTEDKRYPDERLATPRA